MPLRVCNFQLSKTFLRDDVILVVRFGLNQDRLNSFFQHSTFSFSLLCRQVLHDEWFWRVPGCHFPLHPQTLRYVYLLYLSGIWLYFHLICWIVKLETVQHCHCLPFNPVMVGFVWSLSNVHNVEILDLKQKNAQGKEKDVPSPLTYKVLLFFAIYLALFCIVFASVTVLA